MAYRVVELPHVKWEGRKSCWSRASFDGIRIKGREEEQIIIEVLFRNYNESAADGLASPNYFRLVFKGVLEYRFTGSCVYYEDIPAQAGDYEFGVIEILDSRYIENMVVKGGRSEVYPIGERLGRGDWQGMDERAVRHFRIAFDDWGKLDILTFNFSIETAESA